ncbi:MAG TPA: hypothetical protein VIT91_08110 [Chthoniobacterales bacterium]
MSKDAKEAMGNDVFAEFDGYAIVLTTNHGYGVLDEISLEPDVWAKLEQYVARVKETEDFNP